MFPILLISLILFIIVASWAYHDAILCTGSTRSAWIELVAIVFGALLVAVPFLLYFSGALHQG